MSQVGSCYQSHHPAIFAGPSHCSTSDKSTEVPLLNDLLSGARTFLTGRRAKEFSTMVSEVDSYISAKLAIVYDAKQKIHENMCVIDDAQQAIVSRQRQLAEEFRRLLEGRDLNHTFLILH